MFSYSISILDDEIYPSAKQSPLAYPLSLKKKIVLHITQGQTASGTIEYFKGIVYRSHFLVDRNGDVYQLAPISEFLNHASQVNGVSVGIEHVAIAPGTYSNLPAGLPPTEVQYTASAALVRWLSGKLGIPIDRQHVQSHNEASPQDHHVGCCEPTLSVDKIIEMANSIIIPT